MSQDSKDKANSTRGPADAAEERRVHLPGNGTEPEREHRRRWLGRWKREPERGEARTRKNHSNVHGRAGQASKRQPHRHALPEPGPLHEGSPLHTGILGPGLSSRQHQRPIRSRADCEVLIPRSPKTGISEGLLSGSLPLQGARGRS